MKNKTTTSRADAQTKASSGPPEYDHFGVLHALVAPNGLSPKAKLVGIKLYLHESEERGAYNAVPNLARDVALGTTATREALRELTEAKVYWAEERPGTTTRYRSNPAVLFALVAACAAGGGEGDASRRAPQRNPLPTPTESVALPQRNPLTKSSDQKLSQEPCEENQSAASCFPDVARATGPEVVAGQHPGVIHSGRDERAAEGPSAAAGGADRAAPSPGPHEPDGPRSVEGPGVAECAPPPEPTGDNHPQAAQGDPVTGVQGEAAPSGRTEDETPAVPPMCDGNAGVKNAAVLPTDSAGGATSGATTPVLSLDATAEVLVPAPGRSSASQAPADEHNPTLDALRDRVAIFAVLERFATRRFCENLAALVPGKGLPTVLASINAAAAELDARNRVAGACPDPVEAARFVLGHCRSFQPRPTGGDESHLGDDVRALLGDLRAADGLADVADVDTAERIDRARERDGGARLSLAATRAAIASAVEKVCPKSPGPRRLRAALESFVQSQRDFEPGPEAELATDDERAALGAWRRAVIDAGKPEPKLFPEDFEGIRSLAGHARRLAKAAAREPSFRRPKRRSMGVASSGRKHAYWPPLEAFRGPDEDASFGLTLPRLATDFVSRAGDDVRARGLNPRPPKYDWQGQLGWVPSLAHGLGDDRRRDDLVPAERARLALENLSAVRTARDAAEALAWLLEGPAPIFAPRAEIEAERDRAAEAAQVGPPSAWQEPEMWARRRSDPRAPSNVDRVPAAMNGWSEIELRALSPRSTLRSVGQPTPALSARGRAIADALGAAVGGPPDEPVAQLWAEVLGPDGPTDDAAVFVARRRALGGFVLSGGGHHAGDARAWWYALPAKERGLKTRAFDADVAAEPLPGDEDGLDAAGRAALETMRAAGLRFATPARAARLAGLLGGAPAHLLAWACRRAPDNADALDAELERLLDLHESGVTFDAPEGPPPPERAPRANPDRPNRFVVPRLTPALGPVPTAAEVRARLAALPPAAPPPAPEGTEVEAYDEGAEAGEHGWADDVDPPAPRARLESGVYLRSGEELAPPEAAEALAAS